MYNVKLSQAASDIMNNEGRLAFPDECCGFLFGTDDEDARNITIAVPVTNSKDGDRRRRFEIAPLDYMKAENYAVQHHIHLLGVYHTHPLHPAIPSSHDLAQAMPFFSYIILSVTEDEVIDIRSWRLNEETMTFDEETIIEQ